MPSKSDTIPAMLTPGEVVLNEKQQKALEKYVGQSREEIFGKIKVPGFNIGGKMPKAKYQGYKKGGKADKARSKTERELALGIYRKQMAGKSLDPGWETEYSKSGSYKAFKTTKPYGETKHRHRKAMEWVEKYKTGGKVKKKKKYNKGGMVKKAYSRMYKAKWGG